jgi:hypothetical protein
MNFATKMKDSILNILRDAIDASDYMTKAEQILQSMMLCDGVWVQSGYAYKAQEIANIIGQRMTELSIEQKHWKTHEKIDRLRIEAYRVVCHFCKLQYQYREEQRKSA